MTEAVDDSELEVIEATKLVARLLSNGAFEACMWGRAMGTPCPQTAETIVEAVGMVDVLTIAWAPACDAHAPGIAHFLLSQVLVQGRATTVSRRKLRRHARTTRAERALYFSAEGPPLPADRAVQFDDATTISARVGWRRFWIRAPRTTPLTRALEHGKAAELSTLDAASRWGMPDFACTASIQRHGSGVREVGDSLLLLRDSGIVVQVKRRDVSTTDRAKEIRWLEKAVAKARRQVAGSIRTLHAHPVEVRSARGDDVLLEPNERSWRGVIIIDHDDPPLGSLVPSDCVVLTRSDWEFLFSQLKSTHAVAAYLEIAADPDLAIGLGFEQDRYLLLAQADLSTDEKRLAAQSPYFTDGHRIFANILPVGGRRDDPEAHSFYRSMLEQVALHDSSWAERFLVLALLDSLPHPMRRWLGRVILDDLKRSRSWWRRRRDDSYPHRLRLSADHPQVVVTTATRAFPGAEEAAQSFAVYQHRNWSDIGGFRGEPLTISIFVISMPQLPIPWEIRLAILRGRSDLSDAAFEDLRRAFGPGWDDGIDTAAK